MSRFAIILALVGMLCTRASGQGSYTLSGVVTDKKNKALSGASIILHPAHKARTTDSNGKYTFGGLPKGVYVIEISHLGFVSLRDTITIEKDALFNARLLHIPINLQEVIITDSHAERLRREESVSVESVNSQFIKQYQSGSLMKTLERLPGISTISIGSGQSKPVIRGLSFNRVVVVDNGIKHEGQQWGTDHGLEIDQYAITQADVIKGPASLMHGSDAIGGAIVLNSNGIPPLHTVAGSVDLLGKTNNALLGTSVFVAARKKSLFGSVRMTLTDYADYKVPTDSIDIYSYKAALHENRLRNTAGREQNFHVNLGVIKNRFTNRTYLSRLSSTGGFFANAHGLEPINVDTDLHDKSDRDILYPRHQVTHFKAINKTQWNSGPVKMDADLGFQHNFRQEWSPYVNHGFMPPVFPDTLPFKAELEREFEKFIYSANMKLTHSINDKREIAYGINAEIQDNKINGRGFIIPAFAQKTAGGFVFARQTLTSKSLVNLGIRYDLGNIQTQQYSDWYPSLNAENSEWFYAQRAQSLSRNFSSLSWSLGYNYNLKQYVFKANIGKSFRMPIAKELAANGVNYHHFSYELGDAQLSPEVSYQLDLGGEMNSERLALSINPFLNYFSNYIYLNPTHLHDRMYGNGNQIFQYTQAAVFRLGGELHAHYRLLRELYLGVIGEYVYSEQLSGPKNGFSLPFSPAPSATISLKYQKANLAFLKNAYLFSDFKITLPQHHIVPPEESTAGYQELNLGLGGEYKNLRIFLQVNNALNSKHFNHTSYYRLINVPEPGRNFSISLSIPFEFQNNKQFDNL